MADSFGLSFAPLQGQGQGAYGSGTPDAQQTPIQQAIQILSLRRPTTYGAASVAPPALLNSAGGGGVGGGVNALMTLLQHLKNSFGMEQPGPVYPDQPNGGTPVQSQGGFNLPAMRNPNPFAGIFGEEPAAPPSMSAPTIPAPRIVPGDEQRGPSYPDNPPSGGGIEPPGMGQPTFPMPPGPGAQDPFPLDDQPAFPRRFGVPRTFRSDRFY